MIRMDVKPVHLPSWLSLCFFLCRVPFSPLPLYVSIYYSFLPKPTSILVFPSISLSCMYFRLFASLLNYFHLAINKLATPSVSPHTIWHDQTVQPEKQNWCVIRYIAGKINIGVQECRVNCGNDLQACISFRRAPALLPPFPSPPHSTPTHPTPPKLFEWKSFSYLKNITT
jgi:hypothetical protein